MGEVGVKNPDRRTFVVLASAAAVSGLAAADSSRTFAQASAASGTTVAPSAFQLITPETIRTDITTLQSVSGNIALATHNEFSVVLTTEAAHSAKEFEWHEERDHILQVIEGATVYELGGTPRDSHSPKPGEWLAPASEGATTLTLSKGDMLIIPRGTLHKRSTARSVTFLLISPSGVARG
jgi:quercetin dioxygenase-like cupin family protein